jgi:dethiobiotin synthetase
MRNGYLEEKALSEENLKKSFDYAAEFSANNCLVEGAFGFASPIEVGNA